MVTWDIGFLTVVQLQARSTARATPARSSTALASSSRTGVRSPRSAASCSTTSRPSSKRLDRATTSQHTADDSSPATLRHNFLPRLLHILSRWHLSETKTSPKATVISGCFWNGGRLKGSWEGKAVFSSVWCTFSRLAGCFNLAGAGFEIKREIHGHLFVLHTSDFSNDFDYRGFVSSNAAGYHMRTHYTIC